jgi:hypothetical protein
LHLSHASRALPVCLLVLAIGTGTVTYQSEDPRISSIILGRPVAIANMYGNPMRILSIKDPLFIHAEYPIRADLPEPDRRKLDRVYYPRTRQELIGSYDFMVLHSAQIQHFLPAQFHDLDYAFREAGMAGFYALDLAWQAAIQPSILRDVVPVSEHYSASPFVSPYSVRFHVDRDPVFLPFVDLGIEGIRGIWFCKMIPQQGATVWADIVNTAAPFTGDLPWLVSWKPGGGNPGVQWIVPHTFDPWWEENNNPYALDIATNMVFHSLDIPLISDIHGRREARRLFHNVQTQKSLILTMIEWASKFGADVTPLWDRLRELELELGDATMFYFRRDYAATVDFLDSMNAFVMEMTEDAVRIKNEALFWVFVSEWLVTSSVGLVSGVALWSLMVRRRAYRTVAATRLKPC